MIYALLAYLCWGFFPIYWKLLKHVPLLEILSQRVLWAFVFYTILLSVKNKRLFFFKPANKKSMFILAIASILLMANWLIYIYAVNSNQILEGSLGYFINPLFNILLGVIVLKEKLTKDQIIAVAMATVGVGIITLNNGHLPWIALVLASTFCLYGYLKKLSSATGAESNQFESVLFIPLALGALVFSLFFSTTGSTDFITNSTNNFNSIHSYTFFYDLKTWALFIGSGIVTGLPLIFFSEAARRIPYYLMGFFQFLAPTLQFMTGVLIFNEAVTTWKLIGFGFIWAGIVWLIARKVIEIRQIKISYIKQ